MKKAPRTKVEKLAGIVEAQNKLIAGLRELRVLDEQAFNVREFELNTELSNWKKSSQRERELKDIASAANEAQTETIRALMHLSGSYLSNNQAIRNERAQYRSRADYYKAALEVALANILNAQPTNWFQRLLARFMPPIATPYTVKEKSIESYWPSFEQGQYAIPHTEPIKDNLGRNLVETFDAAPNQTTVFQDKAGGLVPACGHGNDNQVLRFYERPGGPEGNVYVCRVCYPIPETVNAEPAAVYKDPKPVSSRDEVDPNEGRSLKVANVFSAPSVA